MALGDFNFDPATGWNDTDKFPDYPARDQVRPLLQKLFDQIKTWLNVDLKTFVNGIDTALTSHLAEIATDDELGHVKVDGTTITADENGVISIASAPTIPAARVYHDASQSIANNTETVLAFNSERFDTDTMHNNSTNNSRLTCKTAGKYIITAGIDWQEVVGGDRQVIIRLNGTTILAADRRPASSGGKCNQTITTVYDLAVNDYIEIIARHTQGDSLSVISGSNYSPEFSMVLEG